MIGMDEIIDLDMLPEAQAASITSLGGPVSQYQLDMITPIDDGEAFILHDEVLEDALEAEEHAAAKQAPKRKHLNERLAEKEASEIAPFVDSYHEVPPVDNRFQPAGDSHLLKLGSHYMRADPPIPVTGQLPRPIGKAYPVNQDWFDVCDLQLSNFLALIKEARRTLRDQLTLPMHAALQRVTDYSHAQWLKHFAAQVALREAHNGPAWASKPKKDAGEQH